MQNALIAGGAGFIGSNLTEVLIDKESECSNGSCLFYAL